MKNNKGAISLFALLSMMFFLIFIMVAYNNVAQKGKNQVETEEILVDYYKSTQTAAEITNAKNGGAPSSIVLNSKLRGLSQLNKANYNNGTNYVNKDKYIYSNGNIYKILDDYQQVEYIESSGSQYIDTDYYWDSENIEIYFDGTVVTNSSEQALFGNEEYLASDGNTKNFAGVASGQNGSYGIYVGNGSVGSISTTVGTRFNLDIATNVTTNNNVEVRNVKVKKDGQQIINVTYTGSVITKEEAYLPNSYNISDDLAKVGKIYIFANHNSNRGTSDVASQNIGKMRLYSFKLFDNGNLVRDFVPCKQNSDGAVGLYDVVEGKFYHNSGTGVFESGPNFYK